MLPDKFPDLLQKLSTSLACDVREQVLAGQNFEYDPDAIKREEEERRRQEEAAKPRKRDEIYPGELRQISEILEARYHLLQQGQLYRAGEERQFEPIEPLRALPVDAALVWIALRECLENPGDAEKYVKNIILRYLNLVTPDYPGHAERTPEDINIEESRPLVEIYENDEQRLPQFMMVSFYYLYDVHGDDIQSRDRTKRDFYGRMAVQCAGDAWRLYAQVMNIFGWKISERWIADPDQG